MQPAVLIVDDHVGFRASARALLEAAGYTVAGEAGGAADAVAAAHRLRPAFVLLDVELPDGDGFEVAEALAALPDPPVVLLVSVRDRPSYRRRAGELGARAASSPRTASPARRSPRRSDAMSDVLDAVGRRRARSWVVRSRCGGGRATAVARCSCSPASLWLAGSVPGVTPLLTAHRGPLVHAALALPGRAAARARPLRSAAALAWVTGLVPPLAGPPA